MNLHPTSDRPAPPTPVPRPLRRGTRSVLRVSSVVGAVCALSLTQAAPALAAVGDIATVAGNGTTGDTGDGGPATSAGLAGVAGVAVDSSGTLYVVNQGVHRIRKVSPAGVISAFAGTGTAGFSGDGGPATAAQFNNPTDIAVDSLGNVYVADTANYRVRKVDTAGVVSTVLGTGVPGFSGDGGPGTAAAIQYLYGIGIDGSNNLYAATIDDRVRRLSPAGIVTTVAGTGSAGFSGDGGPATSAQVNNPLDVAGDATGNIFIADFGNNRIRKIDGTGSITTFAGTGVAGSSGDGGPATVAAIAQPNSIGISPAGDVLFAEDFYPVAEHYYRVRRVTSAGIISTFAGTGTAGYSGDGGPATSADIGFVPGLAANAAGDVYLSTNNRVRMVTGSAVVPAVATTPLAVFGATTALVAAAFLATRRLRPAATPS